MILAVVCQSLYIISVILSSDLSKKIRKYLVLKRAAVHLLA